MAMRLTGLILACWLAATVAAIGGGRIINYTNITTAYGYVYSNVVVSLVEPDGLTLTRTNGVVKIPFADLSSEMRTAYAYDEKEASAYTAKVAEDRRRYAEKQRQERQKAEDAKKAALNAEKQKRAQQKAQDAQKAALASNAQKQGARKYAVRGFVIVKIPDGLLVNCGQSLASAGSSDAGEASSGGKRGGKQKKNRLPSVHGIILLSGCSREYVLSNGSFVSAVVYDLGPYPNFYMDAKGDKRIFEHYVVSSE